MRYLSPSRAVVALLLLLSAGLLWGSYYFFDIVKTRLAYQEFKQDAVRDVVLVEQAFRMTHESLMSIRSLYSASDFVSFKEFGIFSEPVIKRHPSIRSLEWIPAIKQNDILAFEEIAQLDFPNYRIFSQSNPEARAPISKSWSYPVLYIHPLKGNEAVLGFDLGSDEVRLSTIEQARDTGQGVATSKTHLIQDTSATDTKSGLIYILPFYQGPSNTIYQRRENIVGFVLAVINLDALILETGIEMSSAFKVQLLEEGEISVRDKELYYLNKTIEFGGKDWIVQVTYSQDVYTTYDWFPMMGLAIMLLICLLFWGIVLWHRSTNKRASNLIEQKTKELSFANSMLTSIHVVAQQFINDEKPERYFDRMLRDLLTYTESEFGLIAQVLYKDGKSYLKTLSFAKLAWDYDSRKYFRDHAQEGIVIDDHHSLFGSILETQELVIINDVTSDPRPQGLVHGRLDLARMIGIPFYSSSKMVGVACLANRASDYEPSLVDKLNPFISNCGYIITEYKIKLERLEQENQNYNRARNDILTQLPNRFLFQEQGEKLLDLAIRKKQQLAVMFIDLDDFKPVNDLHGHDVGDQLLVAITTIFRSNTRGSDFIARLGGDEFAIILSAISGREEPENLAQKLLTIFEKPIAVDNLQLQVGLSIGYALYPENGYKLDHLLSCADASMYQAKRAGKHQVHGSHDSRVKAVDEPRHQEKHPDDKTS